jgi:phosphate transport system permease protein
VAIFALSHLQGRQFAQSGPSLPRFPSRWARPAAAWPTPSSGRDSACLASLIGVPIGIGGGIFLAEFGRGTKLANAVRFTADVLNGVPSIVMGIAVYSLIVVPQKHFLGHFSGGVALGIMMIPTVCRTTEEMLLMVPHAVREAALGLGVPNWRSVLSITVKTASPGIITGCMLAFARVAGETAPLIFTALGNQFWSTSLNEPIAALPLQIYVYAISPYDDQHRLAWAGALVLIVLIVLAVSLVRYVTSRGVLKGSKLSGRRHRGNQPERVVRNQSHAAGHQSEHPGQPCHGADRSLRLRQEHLCALPQPHARDQSHRPRHRHGAHRRPRYLRGRQAG